MSVQRCARSAGCRHRPSAAPARGAEYSLGLAAAQIGRHPYAGFQSHGPDDRPAPKPKPARLHELPHSIDVGAQIRELCYENIDSVGRPNYDDPGLEITL